MPRLSRRAFRFEIEKPLILAGFEKIAMDKSEHLKQRLELYATALKQSSGALMSRAGELGGDHKLARIASDIQRVAEGLEALAEES